jgi:hypothetical protein
MVRAPSESSRTAELDAALREMFETLASQPVPSRLLSVIDQLDDEEPGEEPRKAEPRPDKRRPKRA